MGSFGAPDSVYGPPAAVDRSSAAGSGSSGAATGTGAAGSGAAAAETAIEEEAGYDDAFDAAGGEDDDFQVYSAF